MCPRPLHCCCSCSWPSRTAPVQVCLKCCMAAGCLYPGLYVPLRLYVGVQPQGSAPGFSQVICTRVLRAPGPVCALSFPSPCRSSQALFGRRAVGRYLHQPAHRLERHQASTRSAQVAPSSTRQHQPHRSAGHAPHAGIRETKPTRYTGCHQPGSLTDRTLTSAHTSLTSATFSA